MPWLSALKHSHRVYPPDPAYRDVGGDDSDQEGGRCDAQDALPADENHELRHGARGERSHQDNRACTQDKAQHAGNQALLEHDSVQVSVGESLRLEYAILPRFLDGGRVDREASHGQANDEGHYEDHHQHGQDIPQQPIPCLVGELLAGDEDDVGGGGFQPLRERLRLAGVLEGEEEEGPLVAGVQVEEVGRRFEGDEGHLCEHEVASPGLPHHGEGAGATDQAVPDLDIVAVSHRLIYDDLAGAGWALTPHPGQRAAATDGRVVTDKPAGG